MQKYYIETLEFLTINLNFREIRNEKIAGNLMENLAHDAW